MANDVGGAASLLLLGFVDHLFPPKVAFAFAAQPKASGIQVNMIALIYPPYLDRCRSASDPIPVVRIVLTCS